MMGRNNLKRLGHDLPRVAILLGVSAAFAIAPLSSAFAQGNAAFATAEKSPTRPILLLINRLGAERFVAMPQTTDLG
jgi:hypothetical protein